MSTAGSTRWASFALAHPVVLARLHRLGHGLRRAEAGGLWWSSLTPEGPGAVLLRAEAGGAPGVRAEAWGEGGAWLVERAPALLGAADDPAGFEPRHPLLARLARVHSERVGRTGRMVEALVAAAVGQRVHTADASDSLRLLARRFGPPAPGPLGADHGVHLLPGPERLAEIGYAELHPCGIERRRAEVLVRIGRHADRLEAALDEPREQAYRRLLSVVGVGPWTAGFAMAEAWGDADAVPLGDLHLPRHVGWALAGDARCDDARMLELLAPYGGHRWRVLRLLLLGGPAPPRYAPRRGRARRL
ncbi:MAG: DNA-3-methyladenine glycosylase family protein [Acidimicrobiales bacterium]